MYNHNNHDSSLQLKRVQQWIKRLESKAVELLEGLEDEEMTPKHQADVALKCLDHLQRFTAIEKRLHDASQADEQQDLLAKFMSEARGESISSSPDDNSQITAEVGARLTSPRTALLTKEIKQPAIRELDSQIDEEIDSQIAERVAEEEKNKQLEEDYDEAYWLWIEEQEREWREERYTEEEAWQEEESWLDNGWWLDEEEQPWLEQ